MDNTEAQHSDERKWESSGRDRHPLGFSLLHYVAGPLVVAVPAFSARPQSAVRLVVAALAAGIVSSAAAFTSGRGALECV